MVDITNNHRQNLGISYAGVGYTTPGSVVITLDAIDANGGSELNISVITAMINPTVLA
jgi:hypothetical protein